MRVEVVDELEAFIGDEGLWRNDQLELMVDRLRGEPDEVSRQLGAGLAAVLARSRAGGVSTSLVADIEGVLYPRLWKLLEAARSSLPEAELHTRLRALDRRLSPLLVSPTP